MLKFWFLIDITGSTVGLIITSDGLTLCLGLVVGSEDSLRVLLNDVLRNAFHAEDLNVESRAIRKGIVNGSKILFVDLAHVDTQASGGVQPSSTSFTFEMLCFLMIDEDFEIIKISFAVVTPGTRKDFLDVWLLALLLGHFGGGRGSRRLEVVENM